MSPLACAQDALCELNWVSPEVNVVNPVQIQWTPIDDTVSFDKIEVIFPETFDLNVSGNSYVYSFPPAKGPTADVTFTTAMSTDNLNFVVTIENLADLFGSDQYTFTILLTAPPYSTALDMSLVSANSYAGGVLLETDSSATVASVTGTTEVTID